MYSGGYAGKILRINLSTKTSKEERLSEEMARDFIGGAGFGIKHLFDEVKPGIDPLGPDNILVFAPGPFTGAGVPCASRMAVTGKSPLTGAVGMALSGGEFPTEMKFAGWDAIIIEGKADKPTYVAITGKDVRFRDATQCWGTLTFDCQQIIKNELRDQNVRVCCIGPAGEHLSKMACIINERRAVGRKGLGAVMGSKNLKAVAIRGTDTVSIASEEKYKVGHTALLKAFKAMEKKRPDLILLDLMLPDMDGIEVCRVIKQKETTRNIPIIMVTAKAEEVDRIVGLELGADDYVVKPFSTRELTLRVKGVLRRLKPVSEGPEALKHGELSLYVDAHEVSVGGEKVELTLTEFRLLAELMENVGRVRSRETLLNNVWGYNFEGYERTVDTHVQRLRRKLGSYGKIIETVRGIGYMIKEETS